MILPKFSGFRRAGARLLPLVVVAFTTSACSSGGEDICEQECAVELAVPCAGASPSTKDECVATCESRRTDRWSCLAEDTAYRTCFAQSPISCTVDPTTNQPERTSGACSVQGSALTSCTSSHQPTAPAGSGVGSSCSCNCVCGSCSFSESATCSPASSLCGSCANLCETDCSSTCGSSFVSGTGSCS